MEVEIAFVGLYLPADINARIFDIRQWHEGHLLLVDTVVAAQPLRYIIFERVQRLELLRDDDVDEDLLLQFEPELVCRVP